MMANEYCDNSSDVNKDLGLKAKDRCHKAKDLRSHKANVQRQYLKVKDDNDHKFYVFNSLTNLGPTKQTKHTTWHCEEYVKSQTYQFTEYMSHLLNLNMWTLNS